MQSSNEPALKQSYGKKKEDKIWKLYVQPHPSLGPALKHGFTFLRGEDLSLISLNLLAPLEGASKFSGEENPTSLQGGLKDKQTTCYLEKTLRESQLLQPMIHHPSPLLKWHQDHLHLLKMKPFWNQNRLWEAPEPSVIDLLYCISLMFANCPTQVCQM